MEWYKVFSTFLILLVPVFSTCCEEEECTELKENIQTLEDNLKIVSRQLMMQQFYVEETARANGNSGVKRVRITDSGTRPYYSASHCNKNYLAMHNHANNFRTVGLGEFVPVMNGIESRTRHNDYRLVMKSTTSSEYNAKEDVPRPLVPPEVTNKPTVEEQVQEMKEWFKAWGNQDDSVRDYKQYFKPILCYLEGAWTHSDQGSIEELSQSDRHFLDAKNWLDLQNKIRFTSYSGAKQGDENLAYLPTSINTLINDTIPVLVQWNYKVLCHPLKQDVPLNRFRVVDDLKCRMAKGRSLETHAASRMARFTLAARNSDNWIDESVKYSFLDELMGEIPGADNYMANITDNLFWSIVYPYDSSINEPLNVGYFHRIFRSKRDDANGQKLRRRSFSDENLFVAQTTQSQVAGLEATKCVKRNCQTWKQRWTYAIPIEIIYMTPLYEWNPYNIEYKGDAWEPYGKTIYDGEVSRNGGNTLERAYNGTNSNRFYRTPLEFFENEIEVDSADTTQNFVSVLNSTGDMNRVRASGIRIQLPELAGVGVLRQRWPIMPVHGEGEGVWKELEALKDIVLKPSKFQYMFEDETLVTTSSDCESYNKVCIKKGDLE